MPVIEWCPGVDPLRNPGPLVQVEIGLPAGTDRVTGGLETGHALIDTGAFASMIDAGAAQRMGLRSFGTLATSTAGDHLLTPIHAVGLRVVSGQEGAAPFCELDPWFVLGGNLADLGLLAVLGRDFLRLGILVYHGFTGRFSLSM